MKTISITNQKGGVGKSTIAYNLSCGLARLYSKKVLLLDMDAQCSVSLTARVADTKPTILDIFDKTKKYKMFDAIQVSDPIAIIAGSPNLTNIELVLNGIGKEQKLKAHIDASKEISDFYDYLVIDTPPALGILSLNALYASDYAVIPAMTDSYSLQGIGQISQTIEALRQYLQAKVKIAGIVLNYYKDTALAKHIEKLMKDTATDIQTTLFDTHIRDYTAFKEAQQYRTDIFNYAPKSKAAQDFENFIKELIGRI